MSFRHPLARQAKVWTAMDHNGHEQRVLVIVTTIPLNRTNEPRKRTLIERLSSAAKEYLSETSEATSFVLLNRFRDWAPE
jgi:hypothetical protein